MQIGCHNSTVEPILTPSTVTYLFGRKVTKHYNCIIKSRETLDYLSCAGHIVLAWQAQDKLQTADTVLYCHICQVVNHSPGRPTYGRPMAGSYATVSSYNSAIASY